MIGYVTLGTSDLERGAAFYDAVLGEIGASRSMGNERLITWGVQPDAPLLGICLPFDGKPASVGNGVMVALSVGSKEAVHQVYDKAISLGAADEGPPGPRSVGGFYGGYFRDLDGNKLVAFVFGS
ncbi:MAG: VOC family protein [Deltaproteobacteria bacterium]|nr:VOC family protein [Deltaproteobacteria bacterium]MBW2363033.1 VOC family protein [Deltaproteobacteria bacterium]